MRLFLFGKTECYSHQRWTKEYWMIWDMFWPLSGFKIPWGSPIVPNGQPSVPWEFEIKHFTMGWSHFGKTGCYLHRKWTKDYLMIWGMFWLFSGSEGSPRDPESLKWFIRKKLINLSIFWEVGRKKWFPFFVWGAVGKLGWVEALMRLGLRLIPKVIWTFLHILA